ncbi:hypothetical protein ACKLNO_00820 [Neisseriaceae bacterium B1]
MRKIILLFALINALLGYYLHQQPPALPLFQAADGNWVYPQSSGSDDVHLLAIALQGFVFATFVTIFSRKMAVMAYGLNVLFLWLMWFFVELDGSLWAAARLGFFMPLLAVVWVSVSVVGIGFVWLRETWFQAA